jgi:hypothetical protein
MNHYETGNEEGTERLRRDFCEEADKVSYRTKHDARKALVGQIASKSVRIYQCAFNKGHYHMTKDWAHKRNVK